MADLDHLIRVSRRAVDSTSPGDPSRPVRLNDLANCLGRRYASMGAIVDLEEAIQAAREAVNIISQVHTSRPTLLNNLAIHLGHRYTTTSAFSDLEEAIRVAREAVVATPRDHPDRAASLNNLGIRLGARYLHTGASSDIDEAILAARETINSTARGHVDYPNWLHNLGNRLNDKYSHSRAIEDLDEAICVAREAADATSQDHPSRVDRLVTLGVRVHIRYSQTGAMADLEESIRVVRQAVDAMSTDHPDRVTVLNILGVLLDDLYSATGVTTHLEEAIRLAGDAVNNTALEDHRDRARWLNNFGSYLGDRYSRTGAMVDLEEAIRVAREAAGATPQHHPDRARRLSNLGVLLGDSYSRTGTMADLEGAIYFTRDALGITPQEHPNHGALLNNLGIHLAAKYRRTGVLADLEESIRLAKSAINATPEDHPDRPGRLNNLSVFLGEKYSTAGALTDLEEAIGAAQTAVNATPLSHPDRPGRLNAFGARLGDRYLRTEKVADLEESIRLIREAVSASPEDHPERADLLNNLGTRLGHRHSRIGAVADLKEGKRCFILALRQTNSVINERIKAGRLFLSSPNVLDDPDSYKIATETIDLIPMLASRSLQNTDKRQVLSAAVGLASDAAAIATYAGRDPICAIKLLETGRGVIAGSLFENCEVSAFKCNYPRLASLFDDLRNQLNAPGFVGSLKPAGQVSATAGIGIHTLRESEQQLIHLLENIRAQPGLERFLLPASEKDMVDAARRGPIIVLNMSLFRCDAFIVEESGIRLLALSHVSLEATREYSQDLRSLRTLGWLWDVIVCPVIDALGFTSPPSNGQLPHVWWIPTGVLTRFPLHAAGHHLRRNGDTALDRVVSSYATSVKVIIHSRRQPAAVDSMSQNAASRGGKKSRIVALVGMEDTPNQSRLGFAKDEIDAVLTVCEAMGMQGVRSEPYKIDVLSALETCDVFHFAGHGSTDHMEPLQSKLLLEDWRQAPFTVQSLLETTLTSKSPFLAYLSACGTSQLLDETSVDESIHLASACQLAGFRHVVGTLWSVDDGLSVEMARMTYEYLRDQGMTDESVARGLHCATRRLRDEWVSERHAGCGKSPPPGASRDAVMEASLNTRQGFWVPYVHFGV